MVYTFFYWNLGSIEICSKKFNFLRITFVDIDALSNQTITMEIQGILISVASLLFAGNIFFIRKLVDKVEGSSSSAQRMELSLRNFDAQLRDIKTEIKELRGIQIDVAVLKSKLRGEE